MSSLFNRRSFLKSSAKTTAMVGLGGLRTLNLASVSAGPAARELMPVHADIEPLVRLIHETPRERVVAVMIEQVRRGLSYRRFLTANYLATIRYDLSGAHGAFVAHSVNQLALDLGREDQFLPLFYHVGVLRSQDRNPYLWRIADGDLPPGRKADPTFRAAMQADDPHGSARALLALARHEGPRQAFERLWPYAAERNRSSGGHTAVAIANAFRTLETIGWEHAEPVLQFLAYECRARGGEGPEAEVCRENNERARIVAELPAEWSSRRGDHAAVLGLVAVVREGRSDRACRTAYERLRQGTVRAGDVWDAVFLATAELMMRFRWCGPSGLAGHSVTCANALYFAFRTVTGPSIRLFTLLEAVQWAATFFRSEGGRDPLRSLLITDIAPIESPRTVPETVEEIFGILPPRRSFDFARSARADQDRAMQLTYALARRTRDHQLFLQTARRLLCRKSTFEVHDVKFPVALLEHYDHSSPEWKPNLLAASVHYLHGTRMEDSPAVSEAREALGRS